MSVGEAHPSHTEPLCSGWEIFQVLGAKQWDQRLMISLSVVFKANKEVYEEFACPSFALGFFFYLGIPLLRWASSSRGIRYREQLSIVLFLK